MLEDRTLVQTDEELPQTGLSREWERILSAPFVLHPDYGTRSSTVLLLEHSGAFVLTERRFDRQGDGERRVEVDGEGHRLAVRRRDRRERRLGGRKRAFLPAIISVLPDVARLDGAQSVPAGSSAQPGLRGRPPLP